MLKTVQENICVVIFKKKKVYYIFTNISFQIFIKHKLMGKFELTKSL